MKKRSPLAAGIALAMACLPITSTFVVAATSSADIAAVDHSMRASKLIGMTVYNGDNAAVGKVEEIILTGGSVEPSAILSVGEFVGGGGKLVSVPLSHLHLAADKVAMPTATKEHLASMPNYSLNGLNGGGG